MKICLTCNAKFNILGWKCPSCDHEPAFVSGHYILNPELNCDFGYPQDAFEHLFSLESSNFWFRSRNSLIMWAIDKYFRGSRKMLEIGCGTGFVLLGISNAFPNLFLTGSDISSVGLAYAAKRVDRAELVQFDASAFPFEAEFDIVGAFDVLEHIEDDKKVLSQMHKAVATGGGIVITVPQHRFLWSQTDVLACHKRRYNAKELKTIVTSAGFEIIRVTSFVSFLFPAMFVSRMLKKKEIKYDDFNELKLNRIINYILEKVLDFERMMLRLGVNIPFGGSLLLIARKA